MPKPRYRRRKEDRPREITEAAYQAFAEKGYAATRVEEVAKRAGVSKGLMYLYFKTKEDLFKAVIGRVVVPRVDSLMTQSAKTDRSAEEFLRGPFTAFLKKLPGSPVSVVVRLMVSEGWRYPELVEFYWDNVISRGLESVNKLLERGIAAGEFSRTPVSEHPQLFIAPAIMAVLWKLVFDAHPLDSDRLIDTQIDLLLGQLKSEA
jgi:AcrR family transcriptional regulator